LVFQRWAPSVEYFILAQTVQPAVPYWVWKPVIDKLKTMNYTEARSFSSNITTIVVPYWGLGPYYVSSITTAPSLTYELEPPALLSQWEKIFPINSFRYYPNITIIWTPSYSTQYTLLISHQVDWIWAALTTKQMQTLNSTGQIDVGTPYYDHCNTKGLWLNPNVYPWNSPIARQALNYVLNKTAIPLVFTPSYFPTNHNLWFGDWLIPYMPKSIDELIINYTVNYTQATEMLKSVGLVNKGGYWYLPNGTQLTLTIYVPSNLVDMEEEANLAALELSEFGISAKVIAIDPSTLSGSILPSGQYQAVYSFYTCNIFSYEMSSISFVDTVFNLPIFSVYNLTKAWPFAWPNVTNYHLNNWYCQPYTAPASLNLPNNTIITCVNSTYGHINLTNWKNMMQASPLGSPEFEQAYKIFTAWWEYFAPQVEGTSVGWVPFGGAHWKTVIDFDWAYYSMPIVLAQAVPTSVYVNLGSGGPFPAILFGFGAPEGIIPPMAQAILNGSLWTEYPQIALFLGLTNQDLPRFGPAMFTAPAKLVGYNGVVVPSFSGITAVQQAVANYFHTTYTPVTSTSTSTSVTTSTSTMTKTISGLSLPIIGVIIVVIIILAIAVYLVLTRRR